MIRALTELKSNESGTIREIRGGGALTRRLGALGITPGRQITKISSMSLRGPVTVQVNRSQIALGFGMASTILVDIDRKPQ
ncbi:MAG: ferrous iron transport protein A [Deltaproteobacteria bacterium]|nr:ferrous iron transport protein A [Deltaproteobacteria bacterium]MBN2687448.1 ferrous iron transport protein A [Deltaproteobacteria bacterium]